MKRLDSLFLDRPFPPPSPRLLYLKLQTKPFGVHRTCRGIHLYSPGFGLGFETLEPIDASAFGLRWPTRKTPLFRHSSIGVHYRRKAFGLTMFSLLLSQSAHHGLVLLRARMVSRALALSWKLGLKSSVGCTSCPTGKEATLRFFSP